VNIDDLERLAEDLRQHAGLAVEFLPDPDPEGLHVLQINRVDFFFYADGSGYDGWGMQIVPPNAAS
jgi:hypothetical protein